MRQHSIGNHKINYNYRNVSMCYWIFFRNPALQLQKSALIFVMKYQCLVADRIKWRQLRILIKISFHSYGAMFLCNVSISYHIAFKNLIHQRIVLLKAWGISYSKWSNTIFIFSIHLMIQFAPSCDRIQKQNTNDKGNISDVLFHFIYI